MANNVFDNKTGLVAEEKLLDRYRKLGEEQYDILVTINIVNNDIIIDEKQLIKYQSDLQNIQHALKNPKNHPYSYTTEKTLNDAKIRVGRAKKVLADDKKRLERLNKLMKDNKIKVEEVRKKLAVFRKEHGY